MSQDAVKKFKKGDVLFKENDPCQSLYIVQAGKLMLFVERAGKKIEIGTAGANQVLGEQGLITTAKHNFGVEAQQQSSVFEIPIDTVKSFFEKLPPTPRMFVRGLIEESKQARLAMRTLKLEGDKSPMPQMAIPRLFTLLHLLPRHVGKPDPKDPKNLVVSWMSLKQSAIRFFGESPSRLRSLMDLLLKLKIATFEVKVGEEGEENLEKLTITDIQRLEDFAEFYQYHLFKGQRAEAIFVDSSALKIAKGIVEFSEGAPVDHKGGSVVDYNELLKNFKTKYRLDLNNTHFDNLEKEGLYVQRRSMEGGQIVISFDRAEFVKMSFFWSVIHEIDKWNEKGIVDLNEKEVTTDANAGPSCPQCSTPYVANQKFCGNCGFKLAA